MNVGCCTNVRELGGVSLHGEGYHIAMAHNNMEVVPFQEDCVSFRMYNEMRV